VIAEDIIGSVAVAFQFLDEAVYIGKEDVTGDIAPVPEFPATEPTELEPPREEPPPVPLRVADDDEPVANGVTVTLLVPFKKGAEDEPPAPPTPVPLGDKDDNTPVENGDTETLLVPFGNNAEDDPPGLLDPVPVGNEPPVENDRRELLKNPVPVGKAEEAKEKVEEKGEELKKKGGSSQGAIWWMTRELKEAQKYLPKKKQQL